MSIIAPEQAAGVTIELEPLLRRAEELEAQARQIRERAAQLAGQAEGLREAARLIAAQVAPAAPQEEVP